MLKNVVRAALSSVFSLFLWMDLCRCGSIDLSGERI